MYLVFRKFCTKANPRGVDVFQAFHTRRIAIWQAWYESHCGPISHGVHTYKKSHFDEWLWGFLKNFNICIFSPKKIEEIDALGASLHR